MRKAVGIVAVWVVLIAVPSSQAAVWNVDENGNWSDVSKWDTGTPPTAAGSVADLNGPDGITADRTVTLDVNASVGLLILSDTNGVTNSWAITQGGANTLTLDATSGNPAVSNKQGAANQISVPVAAADAEFNVYAAAGSRLEIGGNISGNKQMNLYGTGLLQLSGSNSFTRISCRDSIKLAFTNANAFGAADFYAGAFNPTLTLTNASGGARTITNKFTSNFSMVVNFAGSEITSGGNWTFSYQPISVTAPAGQTVTFTGQFLGSLGQSLGVSGNGTFVFNNNASALTVATASGAITLGSGSSPRVVVANDQALGNTNVKVRLHHGQILSAMGGTRTVDAPLEIYGYQNNGATYYDYFEGTNALVFTGTAKMTGINGTRLVMNDAATTVAFNGDWLANSYALYKDGPGTLAINGNASAILGGLNVITGAVCGTGTLPSGATTIYNGATIAPGTSATTGTLTAAAVTMQNNSTYRYGAGNLVAVSGALSLANTWKLNIVQGEGDQELKSGRSLTLFTYGSLAGAVTNLTPTVTFTGFSFSPSVTLTNEGSSIVLRGLHFGPETGTVILLM